jgi:hypothetical protein
MAARISSYLRQNALGLVAVFIALSAGAYAATDKAARNSVVSKSIKNGQVKKKDLGRNSVNAAKVADDSLTGGDIDESSLEVPGDGNSGGTVRSVGTGAGLTGGPITESGTIALEGCPTNQILKSTGSDYACAADDDLPPANSVGTGEIVDASLTSSDLGDSIGTGTDPAAIADGDCGLINVTDFPGVSWSLIDFVITSASVDLPTGVILTGEVVGPNDVELQICNFSGAEFDPPNVSYLFTVIDT